MSTMRPVELPTESFKRKFNTPSEKGLFSNESLLDSLSSTVKEYMLYVRMQQIFRLYGVNFEGDSDFWGMLIRGCLNLYVHNLVEAEERVIRQLENQDIETFVRRLKDSNSFWQSFAAFGFQSRIDEKQAAKVFGSYAYWHDFVVKGIRRLC